MELKISQSLYSQLSELSHELDMPFDLMVKDALAQYLDDYQLILEVEREMGYAC